MYAISLLVLSSGPGLGKQPSFIIKVTATWTSVFPSLEHEISAIQISIFYILIVNALGMISNVAGNTPIGSPSIATVTSLSFEAIETCLTCV